MSALADLTNSIAALDGSVQALSSSVDAAVTVIQSGTATEAQLVALQQATDNLKVTVDTQASKLNDAVAPPAPEPPAP